MNNTLNLQTALPGLIAIAAILLSLFLPFNADTMVGFGAVAAILGIAALEYGATVKRKLTR